jgi:prolyl-tRNA synthetase
MRTRLFLRTAEFLWQEGHTAHTTAAEAITETKQMLDVYAEFVEEWMALPVVKGVKTANERFAGADDTYCIEAMMQDGKALQAGTSHFLGQNFAKAFDVKFLSKNNEQEYVWATSWGVSTRLMGALVMAHSDDDGLIIPPKLAPTQVVIIPIPKPSEELTQASNEIVSKLKARGIRVKVDDNDHNRPGFKFAEYEKLGIPIRLGIGARDLANNSVEVARRDTKEKMNVPLEGLDQYIDDLLQEIQRNIYNKAKEFQQSHITEVDSWEDFLATLDGKGGFVSAHWDGTSETEDLIKEETKATIRCIPLNNKQEDGFCIRTGKPSKERVLFARAY